VLDPAENGQPPGLSGVKHFARRGADRWGAGRFRGGPGRRLGVDDPDPGTDQALFAVELLVELPEDPPEDDPDVDPEFDELLESFDPPESFADDSFADDPESEDPDDDSDEPLPDDSDDADVELPAFSRLSLR
jgi:hypothetical protein